MLDNEEGTTASDESSGSTAVTTTTRTRRRAASRPAGPPPHVEAAPAVEPAAPVTTTAQEPTEAPAVTDQPAAKKAPAKKATAKRTTRKAASRPAGAPEPAAVATGETGDGADSGSGALFSAPQAPQKRARTRKKAAPAAPEDGPEKDADGQEESEKPKKPEKSAATAAVFASPVFQQPDTEAAQPSRSTADDAPDDSSERTDEGDDTDSGDGEGSSRRRRRRGGRRRRRSGADGEAESDTDEQTSDSGGDAQKSGGQKSGGQKSGGQKSGGQKSGSPKSDEQSADEDDSGEGSSSRRRRRRRRKGEDGDTSPDDPANTVTRVREPRNVEDEITSVSGSTRLEAKKQRRREGREAGRRRAPIVSEAEFLARRESVKRQMVIRQSTDLTQIAVVEDDVLVEHYVARESQTSLIGNVYLGRVQNVLPSMEAAFIDIGKGRNAVLYAGEVDWKSLGNGKPRKIEEALKSGQSVLVQVTKDPIGHKGARLTSQISLAGRFLVYVPGGQTSGISRKLPDTERNRLKSLLKDVLPDEAGVIIRTAAEGATEEQLTRDVSALTARWEDIEKKVKAGNAPQLLYGEPDLTIKVVRDLFNEDFASLVVEGEDAWDMIRAYVDHVAPDLADRVTRWSSDESQSSFEAYRIDEQIAKGLDRKVWLPSGGSLVIDRTEAMTVVDVNTGKFTGSGGNLEETVTKNNLEAAEEIVRQLRLRDIGGIIVVDFIDMVLESNRDLVLRRLVECLGRDRTRHQVAEVTSLGLVQMTRKRIGTGLLEAFSEPCEHCQGRGLVVHDHPVEPKKSDDGQGRGGGRRRGGGGSGSGSKNGGQKSDGGRGKDQPTKKDQAEKDEPKTDGASPESGEDAPQEAPVKKPARKRASRAKKKPEPEQEGSSSGEGSDGGAVEAVLTSEGTAP